MLKIINKKASILDAFLFIMETLSKMNFKQWLENHIKSYTYQGYEDEEGDEGDSRLKRYVDPDFMYRYSDDIHDAGGKILAFIYTSNHQMFYSEKFDDMHSDIASTNNIKSSPHIDPFNQNLHGRLAAINNKIYVSFWESDPQILGALLKPCLRKLEADRHIDFNRDVVSLPNFGTIPISEIPRSFRKLSPEEEEKQELMKKLHLMNPQQKREAMGKLGLATGYKKNDWQIASDKLNITTPGRRLWALNSESFTPNNLPYGWIDPQGNYHALKGYNTHLDGARLHGFSGSNYDEPFAEGWMRITYFREADGPQIWINNEKMFPNSKQLKTVIDYAIENHVTCVYFDSGERIRKIWSKDDE